MPTAKCKKCGGFTNSTTSNYWDTKDNIPTECYAKWVKGKWIKGCTEPPEYEKDWITHVLDKDKEHL